MKTAADHLFGHVLRGFLLALCAVAALSWSAGAQAHRAALIIANAAYANAGGLANPISDAQIVAAAARRAGFQVTLVTDVTKAGFDKSLREFRQQADGAEVAMVYYAGHGIESGGKNWFLPVDARLQEARDLRFEAIELDGLLETLLGARLRMVVLDACRNNPFGNLWRSGARSSAGGLAETEVEGALVIHAAAGGQLADDGVGGNSPFARSFANRLAEPGLSIHRLGSVVLEDVLAATGGKQRPWTNMSIASREFHLVEAPRPVQAVQIQPSVVAATASDQATNDALMWQGADTANTLDSYQAYLRMFPGGLFANMARGRIARLQATPVAGGAPALARAVETSPPAVAASRFTAPDPAPPAAERPQPEPAPERAQPEPAPAAVMIAARPALPEPVAASPMPAAPEPVATIATPPAATTPAATSSELVAQLPLPPPAGDSSSGLVVLAQLGDRVSMPVIPRSPRLAADPYPSCNDDFQAVADPIAKVDAVNRCTALLDAYFEKVLTGFARDMTRHQDMLSRLYTEQVALRHGLSAGSQERFYKAMMKEHADSKPGGAHFTEHAAALARYTKDRAYVADRYCFLTGSCGGYPVPAGVAPIVK